MWLWLVGPALRESLGARFVDLLALAHSDIAAVVNADPAIRARAKALVA